MLTQGSHMWKCHYKRAAWLLFVCCVFAAATTESAQNRAGPIAGAGLADMRVRNAKDGDAAMRAYYGVGGIVDIALNKRVALVLSPMVVTKGAGLRIDGNGTETLKLTYVDLPVLLRRNLGGDAVRPYVLAGPSVGFLIKGRLSSDEREADVKKEYKRTDAGFSLGGGMDIPMDGARLLLEGRYTFGLINIRDGGVFDVKNRTLSVLVSVTFPMSLPAR